MQIYYNNNTNRQEFSDIKDCLFSGSHRLGCSVSNLAFNNVIKHFSDSFICLTWQYLCPLILHNAVLFNILCHKFKVHYNNIF